MTDLIRALREQGEYSADQSADYWKGWGAALDAVSAGLREAQARPSGDEALRAALVASAAQWNGSHGAHPGDAYRTLERAVRNYLARATLATPSSAPDPNFPDAPLVTKIEGEFR